MTSAMTSDRYPVAPGALSRYGYTWAETRNAVVVIRLKQRAERVLSIGTPHLWSGLTIFARLYPASYNRTYPLLPRPTTSPNRSRWVEWRKLATSLIGPTGAPNRREQAGPDMIQHCTPNDFSPVFTLAYRQTPVSPPQSS